MSHFSTVITELRKQKGISQKAAAQELGISQSLLSHYEKGIRECGNDFIIKVASYYQVSCDYLLGVQSQPNSNFDLQTNETQKNLQTDFEAFLAITDKVKQKDETYYNRLKTFLTMSVYHGLTAGIRAGYIPKSWCPTASEGDPIFFDFAISSVGDALLAPVLTSSRPSDEPVPPAVQDVCSRSESCIKYYLRQLDKNI